MKPIVLALVGPTGVGKTAASLSIAQQLNAEIISMDSMQVYRGMDIGTAKPSREELATVAHHLIDVVDPHERFTTSAYRDLAFQAIEDILSRGKQPLLVGGTGLYLDAVSYEMSLGVSGADDEIRNRLRAIAAQADGKKRLHDMLASIDPQSAEKLHLNDVRRVMRALEIYETTGRSRSEQGDERRREGPYHVLVYGLSLPREQMYARINARVDAMMAAGLENEVRALLDAGVSPSVEGGAMQAIGYKEIVCALRGDISMACAVDWIKQGSRRYAKRQWTWFRHDSRTKWFDCSLFESPHALHEALLMQMQEDMATYRNGEGGAPEHKADMLA